MFIVLCLETTIEGNTYPLAATRRLFHTAEEAEQYAKGIDVSRSPSVVDLSAFEDRG